MNIRSRRIAVLGTGAILAVAGISGCGSSESDDYLADASSICNGQNDETTDAQVAANDAITAGDDATAIENLTEVAQISGGQIKALEELEAPEGEEDTMTEYIGLLKDYKAVVEEQVASLNQGDIQAYNATLDPQGELIEQLDTAAKDAGAEGCESEVVG